MGSGDFKSYLVPLPPLPPQAGVGGAGFGVVERTFAWLGRYRRLSKDYEELPETSESFIYAAMVNIMVRRLACLPQINIA